jgi:tRNA (guanine-N7-)-methyltransferase
MTIFSNPNSVPDTCIHRIASILDRFDLGALFPKAQPVEVELGTGDGSFLSQYAAMHPERNFIGVERLLGRLRKVDRKARRSGLRNLRLIRLEAAYFVEYLLPLASIDSLHIYFPDPWPKRKHWKNRLINARFAELAATILKPGGLVYLRTDDAAYFEQMTEVFSTARQFCLAKTPEEVVAVITDFERNFNARGVTTLRAAYQLRNNPSAP